MIEVNVSAVAILSLAFSQLKREEPARLMNVASGAGYALFEGYIPYCASKFFVTAFTEGIAQELISQKLPVRAQLLASGPIATEFMPSAMKGSKMSGMSVDGIEFHSAKHVARLAMQLYDSDAVVGSVEPNMSFSLSGGRHQVRQL
jgi:short-subunit dehydrogenase